MMQARGSGVAIARGLQRRERRRLEDPAFLVLMRTELAAPLQVVLKRGVRHQGVALPLAFGLALVLPDVHDLIQRTDLGGRVEHRLAAVLHLGRMAVLLVELQPFRELAVLQGVNAQIEDHAASLEEGASLTGLGACASAAAGALPLVPPLGFADVRLPRADRRHEPELRGVEARDFHDRPQDIHRESLPVAALVDHELREVVVQHALAPPLADRLGDAWEAARDDRPGVRPILLPFRFAERLPPRTLRAGQRLIAHDRRVFERRFLLALEHVVQPLLDQRLAGLGVEHGEGAEILPGGLAGVSVARLAGRGHGDLRGLHGAEMIVAAGPAPMKKTVTRVASCPGPLPWLLRHVHRAEFCRAHAVTVRTGSIVEDDVIALPVARLAFLRPDRPGRRRNLGPDRRRLQVDAWAQAFVRFRKHLAIDGIDVAVVVDEPVAPLGALLASPFAIAHAVRREIELHRDHEPIGLLVVSAALQLQPPGIGASAARWRSGYAAFPGRAVRAPGRTGATPGGAAP